MTTKAELEKRIARLERDERNNLAALDALSDAHGVSGLRVVCDATKPLYNVLVIGRGVSPGDGAKIAAIFMQTLKIADALMFISAEAVTGVDDATAGGEGG